MGLKQTLYYMSWRLIGAGLHAVRVRLRVTQLVQLHMLKMGVGYLA